MTEAERARAMVERLPAFVRVGAYDFTLEKWTANQAQGAQRWGECSLCEQRISIQLDMASRLKAASTVTHEIGHAVWWVFGVQDDDKEERTVSLLSMGWLCVYRNNPWLLDWLKECVTSQADLVDPIHELMRP